MKISHDVCPTVRLFLHSNIYHMDISRYGVSRDRRHRFQEHFLSVFKCQFRNWLNNFRSVENFTFSNCKTLKKMEFVIE